MSRLVLFYPISNVLTPHFIPTYRGSYDYSSPPVGLFCDVPIPDYTFPNYIELIPRDGTPITFNTNEVLEAVKSLSHIAKDSSGIIRLKFIKKHIELSATNPEIGESKVNCNANVSRDCYTAINYKYLKDYLNQVKNQVVTVAISTPSSPIVFTTQDNNVSVIMPMFVQW